MNHGPLIFLASFFAMSISWVAFVLTPQMQVGQLQQTNSVPAGATYPLARSGLARQGLDVYRANGCAYCHSQQVLQTGTTTDVLLTQPGTNTPAVIDALKKVRPGLPDAEVKALLTGGSKPILRGISKPDADAAVKILSASGAKSEIWVLPVGPDIARGWGKRRTVAHDFVFDDPVMLGSQRIGPDLANIGVRQPDANWHLRHLYAPAHEVKGSTMPPYRFLFERRKMEGSPSPDALSLPAALRGGEHYEIVPRPEARALAAYLLSLRANEPLFVAPLTVAAAPASAGTNAPAASPGATNVPATNQPTK